MNAAKRTLIFVAVAALSVLASVGVKYANRPVVNQDFADIGQEFFPDFSDPLRATSLTVSKYDAESKEELTFSVQQNNKGQWVIPSHHDYPAEARDRLARTATSFMGVKKLALQSRSKDDWGRYGVADPADEVAVDPNAKDGEEDQTRGTLVSMRDSSGNNLVSLIIGKPVEGRNQHFYVRQPEKNNVYIAEINADLSAKFSDWIEPDLLKVNQNDITQVIVDRYSIDEEQGAIVDAEKLVFGKDSASNKWTLEGLDPEAESMKESAVNDLARNLDQLKIVGVRPKPAGLNADLTVTSEVANNPIILQVLQADMQRQGFFIARGEGGKRKLVSNEGEVVAGTKNGVRYTLYFGEIARGTDKEIETGLNETKSGADAAGPEGEEKQADEEGAAPAADEDPADPLSGPRRYVLVKVQFDESLMGEKPTEPVPPVKPEILNDEATPSDADANKAEPKATTDESKADAKPEPADEAKVATESPEVTPKEPAPKDDDAPGPDAPEQKENDGACDEPASQEPSAPESDEPVKVEPAVVPADDEKSPAAADEKTSDTSPPPAAPGTETPDIIPAKTEGASEDTPATDKPETAAAPKDDESTTPAPAEVQPPVDPKAEAQKKYLQEMGRYEAEKSGFAEALKSWEERSKSGQELAKELSERFGSWYYVISADSFEKLRPKRTDVVGPKEAAKPSTDTPPSFDSIPGGLPGGFPGLNED